jgi:hypothetical protein
MSRMFICCVWRNVGWSDYSQAEEVRSEIMVQLGMFEFPNFEITSM